VFFYFKNVSPDLGGAAYFFQSGPESKHRIQAPEEEGLGSR